MDSRIRNLTNEVASVDLAALIEALYLVADHSTFTDAKKVLFKTLLTEAVIDAATNNYQAMTPKSFYLSVMTTTRKGIGQLATDGEVTAKTGTGLLNSIHQVLMQAQWKLDFFTKNGVPSVWYQDNAVAPWAMAWDYVFRGNVPTNTVVDLSPALPDGVIFSSISVDVNVTKFTEAARPITAYSCKNGVYSLTYLGSEVVASIGADPSIFLLISSDGKKVQIRSTSVSYPYLGISAHINATLR